MSSGEETEQLNLHITGMTCAACSARIEKVVGKLHGVKQISVNLATGSAAIVIEPSAIQKEHIVGRIEQLGYGAKLKEERNNDAEAGTATPTKLIWSAILTFPLLWAMVRHYSFTSGLWVPEIFLKPWFQWLLATPVQFVLGRDFYFRAWQALKNRTANMDVLVAISTTAAYFYSHFVAIRSLRSAFVNPHAVYFETSAMIITVVLLGKWLEASAKRRTLQAISRLRSMQVGTVKVLREGKETSVPPDAVRIGDHIVIDPGDSVPVDGQVVAGSSALDESLLTGEAVPSEKSPGDKVAAGIRNVTGRLVVKATAVGDQTALGKMIRLMEEAQLSKADIQRLADRMAAVFVPVVLVLAVSTFCLWMFWLEPGHVGGALFKAMAVLVIACPCALGLATPTSVLVGTGRAAEAGILFKEGKHMEQLQRVGAVLFDKTGTLTTGTPRVTELIGHGRSDRQLLRLLAAAEALSEHPYAKAVVKEAQKRGIQIPSPDEYEPLSGQGVRALADGHEIVIGSKKLLNRCGVPIEANVEQALRLEAEGRTVLFTAVDGNFAGIVALADTVKAAAPQAVRRLKRMGIRVIMVTGDNRRTADVIASKAGIAEVHSEMLPDDKVKLVRRLQQRGERVAMVGDGINDAPALAAADIGIAIGTGTEIAKDAADINLLHSDVNRVADAIVISRKTMRNIRQNLAFALVYNVLAIPLAFMGWFAPWVAGTAMAFSSVSVVSNALRLKRASWRK
ncbi:heavy metal translocating P-type ATPase [Gordoniibacillus kamchatkensis]|uniref:heavy metal translocating P-type ATPase n=1 Tax=Gordoniibacillus kamchatkensis TaxID=1590651 RepID=UPI0006971F08|nr:heavy metal translocating P-type ATPase [Paenibacillus sp. VKM B-2647]